MLEIAATTHLDWSWIEFVGLWLLSQLVLILGVMSLVRYYRGNRRR